MNIVIHLCGSERFILMFDDEHITEAYRTLGRWASNPELRFDWLDAVKCSAKIRRIGYEECLGK